MKNYIKTISIIIFLFSLLNTSYAQDVKKTAEDSFKKYLSKINSGSSQDRSINKLVKGKDKVIFNNLKENSSVKNKKTDYTKELKKFETVKFVATKILHTTTDTIAIKNKKTSATAKTTCKMKFEGTTQEKRNGPIKEISTNYKLDINWNFVYTYKDKQHTKLKETETDAKIISITGSPIVKYKKEDAKKHITIYYGPNGIMKTKGGFFAITTKNIHNELITTENEQTNVDNVVSSVKGNKFSDVKITNIKQNKENETVSLTVTRKMIKADESGNTLTQEFTISYANEDAYKITAIEFISGTEIAKPEPEVVVTEPKVVDNGTEEGNTETNTKNSNSDENTLKSNGKEVASSFTKELTSYVANGANNNKQKQEIIDMFVSPATIAIKRTSGGTTTKKISVYLKRLGELSVGQVLDLKAVSQDNLNAKDNIATINYTQDFNNPKASYCDKTTKQMHLKVDDKNKVKISKITVVKVTADCE